MHGLLEDREGTPVQAPALAQAPVLMLMHSTPADLAALLLDSIAACMWLEDAEWQGNAGDCLVTTGMPQ